jgi:hypothetical protein
VLSTASVDFQGLSVEKGSRNKLFTLSMRWYSYSMKTVQKVGETAVIP